MHHSQHIRIMRSLCALFIILCVAIVHPRTADAQGVCKLALSVTPSVQTISTSGKVTYALVLKNIGTAACTDVRLSEYYSPAEQYTTASKAPTSPSYYWYIGKIAAGKTSSLSITTSYIAAGNSSIQNEACASATKADDACASTTINAVVSSPTLPPTLVPPVPVSLPPATTTSVSQTYRERGIWIWDSPKTMSLSRSRYVIDQAAANGFNTVYVTIDDYLDVYNVASGAAKTSAQNAYDQAVGQFISYAASKNIRVVAESGWRDWGQSNKRQNAYAVLDYVTAYNKNHSDKFAYVQYDVEPYLLSNYETSKAAVLTDYVGLVAGLVSREAGTPIQMVIPHFFGSDDGWTPNITYGSATGSTFRLILGLLDAKPGNSLNIMAYRNHATGSDGAIDISSDEMNEAAGHPTSIIVSQETGNVDPAYVTFYGMSKQDLWNQVSLIEHAFSSNAAFGGVGVDYIDPFLQLR